MLQTGVCSWCLEIDEDIISSVAIFQAKVDYEGIRVVQDNLRHSPTALWGD